MAPKMNSQSQDCCTNTNPLHFLLVPLMAQGHMIPMVDLAKVLAARGIFVTFFSTKVNLARIQSTVDNIAASTLQIRFVALPFPAKDVGLPDGCESADLIPSPDLFFTFMNAMSLLREPLEAHLRDPSGWPNPACIISDSIQNWTADVARTFDIPRIVFHGPSCFFNLCYLLIDQQRAELLAAMEAAPDKPIMLSGLPQPIRISKLDVIPPDWLEIVQTTHSDFECVDGVLVNSFTELEPWYFERYHEMTGKPIWPVGPLSLYKEEFDVKATRGQVSSIDNKVLFQWLDQQEVGSVVLVSFGSLIFNSMAQLVEIGHGLEACCRPFIWVVREAEDAQDTELNEWIDEFEKRVGERGILIRGWAPQTVILEHVAVGGFITHCGWNSTLEAVATGVVMATWPHVADQFFNQGLVVDVLKIGVEVGVEEPTIYGFELDDEVPVVAKVRREEIERAVESLMGGGEEGEERRARARELKEKARMAMEEGGSSWKGLEDLINYVKKSRKKMKQSKLVAEETV